MQQPLAYPPVQVEEKNPKYAREMLGNIGGRDSEMSAVALYFYDHLITREHAEISEAFHRIGIAEMRHLELFGQAALQLGADPRLWEIKGKRKAFWSPKYITYTPNLRRLFTNALLSEHMAVERYASQSKRIRDPGLVALLERVIADEKEHIRIFTDLLKRI